MKKNETAIVYTRKLDRKNGQQRGSEKRRKVLIRKEGNKKRRIEGERKINGR